MKKGNNAKKRHRNADERHYNLDSVNLHIDVISWVFTFFLDKLNILLWQ